MDNKGMVMEQEKGEGAMNRQSSMKTYILLYAKQIASVNLLYDSGYLNWGFCDDLGEWDQVGVYIYIYTYG